jgi:hypothetical protein
MTVLKGTHAREFHSLFLNLFLHLSNTKRSTINIFEKLLKIRPDIRNF